MVRKYKNPPVVEALCEFQFITTQPWDMTIPGLMYEKIRKDFPDKKQELGVGIQFHPTEKGVEQKIEPAPSKVKFLKKDKTALIQIAPYLLVVNQLKPYPIWEEFKKIILDNFHAYKEVANPKAFKRIGLRYINVFEFDEPKIELMDYFKYYPFIPKKLPQTHESFLTRVEFPYENNNERLILTLATAVPTKPNSISLVLDIDYAMIKPEYISFKKIEEWLDKAHERVEIAFEASITEQTRSLFEKEKGK